MYFRIPNAKNRGHADTDSMYKVSRVAIISSPFRVGIRKGEYELEGD